MVQCGKIIKRAKMADIILFGVPKGFDTSRCSNDTRAFLERFYAPHEPGTEMKVIRRLDNSVHYLFMVYENEDRVFCDVDGRSGSFFGIDVMLQNQYITDTNKLLKLFQLTYDRYIKNKIIDETPNGLRKHKFRTFDDDNNTIATYVANSMNALVKEKPELDIFKDMRQLPPVQSQMQRN